MSGMTEHIVSGDGSLLLCNPAIDGVQAAWLDPQFWGCLLYTSDAADE